MIRRHSLRRLTRHPIPRLLLALFLIWDTIHILGIYWAQAASRQSPPPPRNSKRIFIASQHWNNAPLLRDRWNDALVALVKELGVENVYVTIYESGSFDDTKGALRELDMSLSELQVQRTITLSDVTRKDELTQLPAEHGWVKIPTGEIALRRIPFLAKVRNQILDTLVVLSSQGHHFDTILFLNDVVFTPEDVLRLLDTNSGDYAAACSLDYSKPPEFYDTFALRDSSGHEAVMQTWPYFRSYASRYAVQRSRPVPVASCWNGMVVMPIDPFLSQSPLRFRGIPDSLGASHLEASECCLIHADNPFTRTHGVFLNPLVRVGYNSAIYDAVHSQSAELSLRHVYQGIWKNRLLRWIRTPMLKEWVVSARIRAWKKEHPGEDERAGFCLVNEMQIIFEKGWRHV
ncbi:glycosyltransferase family 69 protein [Lentithecium fluviatile CBS 122367]|uniref:Glycosyltransferase family 69 protein n=1 Tax=Lentithecium fluviatile CBS 122367 TaxID=1168545 RepID=A0A6G1JN89_9PLEO|nr:glycosyltransferase family 69 protein [Lentithecium fluviatile CBS 122367]